MRKQGSRGVEKERMRSREVERDKRRHTYTQTKQTNRQRIALASQPPPLLSCALTWAPVVSLKIPPVYASNAGVTAMVPAATRHAHTRKQSRARR